MRILITGATGFIGRHIIDFIDLSINEVIVTSSNENELNKLYGHRNVKIISYDIYSQPKSEIDLFNFFGKPDRLIHLAWKGLPNYSQPFHVTENLVKDFDFLSNLIRNGLSDVTVTGTCFEYGMIEGEIHEDMPSSPTNYYALAKDTLRRMLELLQSKHRFNLKWVRLFYMFGIGQNHYSLVPQLERALENSEQVFNMSGGEQVRDYLPVAIVAKNLVEIALQSRVLGLINNCSGEPVRLIDFVKDYLSRSNKEIILNLGYYPYSNSEPMAFWGNNKKLKSIQCE
jgi:dTDP-6-deoxy-L-talose 4-dehydrogenase (NAD+)